MTYTGLKMFMDNLKELSYETHNPLITNNPSISSQRPQFQLLYQHLTFIIQTLFIHDHLQELTHLKKRFKDAAEEAQDIIDLFLFSVNFREKRGFSIRSHDFKTHLNLGNVMRSIESIKVELMTINIGNMKMNTVDRLKTQSAAAAGISCTRNPLAGKKPTEEVVVGLDRDVEMIRDRLAEDQKQLDVVSIVGMGGLGKTTLATKVFNDRFLVYHFHVRAWATVSQTYVKRDLLIQILKSMGVGIDVEKDDDSLLRGKLHKKLMGKRYLIVIDDIWSVEDWNELKLFFPHEDTGSRILLTSRLNEVALNAKPQGFVHCLPYLTEEESWELLREKVFHGDECPEWLIKPGIQIAKKCEGLPLSVVVMAGVLTKEPLSKDLWEKIACSVGSHIVSDEKGILETLALSYHHLPRHLRECFLYLGGFPEDFRLHVGWLLWLWGAEGLIEEAGNQSLEDTGKAYLMDLVDRNLLIVAERRFNGDVKACKVHDLVRELCMVKAKEERFFLKIGQTPFSSRIPMFITPDKQHRHLFINQDVNFAHPPTPTIRSLFSFHDFPLIYDLARYFHSFALLRVLDLRRFELINFPEGMALLVHLRYLAIWHSLGFPSEICNLWSLRTLLFRTSGDRIVLPSKISNLVNLRHLWSNKELFLPSIGKPLANLQSISQVVLGGGVDNFQICFPNIKKLESALYWDDVNDFELLPYLETLKLRKSDFHRRKLDRLEFPIHEPTFRPNHIWFPATLKKLTLANCCLVWSDMSIIESLPNLEVLKLLSNSFTGSQWNACEQQFGQLKFLRLHYLYIKQWEAYSTSFPCLKILALRRCPYLEEIPLEIGNISTLELIEAHSLFKDSALQSLKRIHEEQLDEGNTNLKITVEGMVL